MFQARIALHAPSQSISGQGILLGPLRIHSVGLGSGRGGRHLEEIRLGRESTGADACRPPTLSMAGRLPDLIPLRKMRM